MAHYSIKTFLGQESEDRDCHGLRPRNDGSGEAENEIASGETLAMTQDTESVKADEGTKQGDLKPDEDTESVGNDSDSDMKADDESSNGRKINAKAGKGKRRGNAGKKVND